MTLLLLLLLPLLLLPLLPLLLLLPITTGQKFHSRADCERARAHHIGRRHRGAG
jgi:hypothetical protein